MNTLLGELATYNDIQYPRYRLAFKLRRLQTSFILHHLDLGVLQDIFHSTGVQPLPPDHEVTEPQLSSVMAEIYSALRSSMSSHINSATLQDAHTTCFNWFLMALQCDTPDSRGTVGILKIVLTLFCGSKTADKAKYLFSVLAKNGTVGLDGLQFFCETVQLLANCLQETIYPDVKSVDRAMSECLYYVRNQDDIEDEEEDGGLQRPWLSCFELVKSFTASPALNFLSWLNLWFSLPNMEKVIHTVKCSICNKKSIKGFRYQCEECSNYHMCQMCFLKGRTSDHHTNEHKVLECQDYTKSLMHRFGLSHSNSKHYRVMDEPRQGHVQLRLKSKDLIDGSANSLHRLSTTFLDSPIGNVRSPSATPEPVHRPTVIRIGSKDSLNSPRREPGIATDNRRHSLASTSSSDSSEGRGLEGATSPQIIGDHGSHSLRRPSPIIPSIRRYTQSGFPAPRSLQRIADEEMTSGWVRKHSAPQTFPRSGNLGMTKTSSDGRILDKREQDEFNRINKKLSLEVDQLLQDIEPQLSGPTAKMSFSSEGSDEIAVMNEIEQEEILQSRFAQASEKKQHLTMELDTLLGQVKQLHSGFLSLKEGTRVTLPHNVIQTGGHHRAGSLDLLEGGDKTQSDFLTLRPPSQYNNTRMSVVW